MQAQIFILGFVQNVGFRQFVKKNAEKLNLKGYVQNLPDGGLEIVVGGQKENIERLIKVCEKGPFLSEVKSVVIEWDKKKEEFQNFEIRH